MIGIKHFSFCPTNSIPRPRRDLSWTSFLERTLKTPQGQLAQLYKKYKAKFKYHSHNNDVWLLITDFGNKANTILANLLDKTYKISSPEQFEFTDSQKKRVYEKYSVEDGLVINLLFHWLKEKLSCRRSDSYYQCEGKGVKKAFNRLKRKATKYRYIYKTDVYSYYASIDQVKLSELLEEELQDKEVVHLIMSIVRASERYEKENASTKGIPLGCSLSMLLAEFYLRKLDKHFEKQLSFASGNLFSPPSSVPPTMHTHQKISAHKVLFTAVGNKKIQPPHLKTRKIHRNLALQTHHYRSTDSGFSF